MPDDDKMWSPVTPEDVAEDNPSMLANHIRALQLEVRDGDARIIRAVERLAERIDPLVERIEELERKVSDDHSSNGANGASP
jgi:phage shock protein A